MTPRLPVIQVHYFQRFQQHWNMPMNISDSRNSTFCTCTFCTFYNVIWISRMLLALNWIFRPLEFNHPPMYKNCPFKLISRVILEWTLSAVSAVSTYIIRYNSPSSLRVSVGGLYKLDNCSVRLYNLYNRSDSWFFSVNYKNISQPHDWGPSLSVLLL